MKPIHACTIPVLIVMSLSLLSSASSRIQGNGWRNSRTGVKRLVREAARYIQLADQDRSSLMAVLHTTLARGLLTSVRSFATDDTIRRLTGVHVDELLAIADTKQTGSIDHVSGLCPQVGASAADVQSTGWVL